MIKVREWIMEIIEEYCEQDEDGNMTLKLKDDDGVS